METKKDYKAKIEKAVTWVDSLMKSKAVVALLLLVDGVMFIINPKGGVNGLAQGVAITVALAAATILLTAIPQKPRTREVKVSIGSALIAIAVSAAFYFFPEQLSSPFVYVLAFFLIWNGISNMLHILRLDRILRSGIRAKERIASLERGIQKRIQDKELSESFREGVRTQFSRRLDPLNRVTGQLGVSTAISLLIDVISIAGGILILFHRSKAGAEFMRVCGAAMFIAAASDLWVIVQAWRLRQKGEQAEPASNGGPRRPGEEQTAPPEDSAKDED